ncbi:MAG: sulfatase [Opitutae bacterium]
MKNLIGLLLFMHLGLCLLGQSERPAKPNVLLMLVDDLGWQDVICYDVDDPAPYETPNLDKLAQRGVLFTNGYSPSPVCSPSRCAIMSGKHPARTMSTTVASGKPPMPHHPQNSFISPWCRGGMDTKNITIAEALKSNGYKTGHVGKWHIAINHYAFPQPVDEGFDFSSHYHGNSQARGVQNGMPNRLQGFATKKENDPYRLDENGYPRDHVTEEALRFLSENKKNPMFLYYASWLVHTPIQTRSKLLLEKYCEKLGVDYPDDPKGWTLEGQRNPYYCAMVETLDYYVGKVIGYLQETEDPRWPGHKLIENTYVIFSSDNGGMEGYSNIVFTDNYPLDEGKIHVREGGIRVPFLVSGPEIDGGVRSEVVVNGLDFYPTILGWTGTPNSAKQILDGCDLGALLKENPTDAGKVLEVRTKRTRESMFWHFPNGYCQQSAHLKNGYKLIYNHPYERQRVELYQLYDASGRRVDWEEAKDLSKERPEIAESMKKELLAFLKSMNAGMTNYNPGCTKVKMPGAGKFVSVIDQQRTNRRVRLRYQENGAKLVSARLIYSLNGDSQDSEWFPLDAKIIPAHGKNSAKVEATLPPKTTHYVYNLVDENNFMVCYPKLNKQDFGGSALKVIK